MEETADPRGLLPPLGLRLLVGAGFFLTMAAATIGLALVIDGASARVTALFAGVVGLGFVIGLTSRNRPLWVRTVSGAYWAALFLTPLSVAAAASLIYGVAGEDAALFAGFLGFVVAFGAPSYFAVGAPMFWLATRRKQTFAATAFKANMIAAPITCVVLVIATSGQLDIAIGGALFVHGFGLAAAPLSGALFGWLFHQFRRADETDRRDPAITLFTHPKEAAQ